MFLFIIEEYPKHGNLMDNLALQNGRLDIDSATNLSLNDKLKIIKSENGCIGAIWDIFKNTTEFSSGSDDLEKVIENFNNGNSEFSEKDINDMLKDYQEGQEEFVELATELGSDFAAIAINGLVPYGLPIRFALSIVAGSITKVILKDFDVCTGERFYNQDIFIDDAKAGALNGITAPALKMFGKFLISQVASKATTNSCLKAATDFRVLDSGKTKAEKSIDKVLQGTTESVDLYDFLWTGINSFF